MKKKLKATKVTATRNHSIGMPLVRVIPSLAMMTWNKEALKAFHGKTRDLVCRYLGNGRLVLTPATQGDDLSKKIARQRPEGSVEFKLRLVINKNRAISRTPTNIVEYLRKNHLSGPFIGKAIKGYPALFVNFSEPASGESVSIGDVLEEAPLVKFAPKAPKAVKPKKVKAVKAKAKKAVKAKPAKKEAPKAAAPKKAKAVKKALPSAPKAGATIQKSKVVKEKVEPEQAAAVVDEDEELSAPVEVGEAETEEQDWAESLEEVAAEEEEGDDEIPSPIRATSRADQDEE